MSARDVTRFVEGLLRGRRPRPFRATELDAAVLRTAIELRAARPGSDAPREEFLTRLHRRLAAELDEPPAVPRRGRNRRQLIQLAGVAAATAVVGAAIEHTVGDLVAADPDPTLKPGPLVPQAGAWQPVVASDALPDGGVTAFDLGEVTGFVRRSAGRISAVSGICTHQGCRLRLDAGEQLLRCPCHDTTFALDGELRSHALPAPPRPLPHLEVRETDGEVEVFAPTQDDESPSGPPPSTAARA